MQMTSGILLVDDGVDDDGGFAGLAVADDELALAAADGDHGVDGLDPGLQGLPDGQPVDDAGRQALDDLWTSALIGPFAVERLAERIDDAADEGRPGGDLHDPVGPLDEVALLDQVAFAEEHGADAVLFQVQGQAEDVARELEQLVVHDPVQAVDAGDAVADRNDRPDLPDIDLGLKAFDLLLDDLADFVCFDGHERPTLL